MINILHKGLLKRIPAVGLVDLTGGIPEVPREHVFFFGHGKTKQRRVMWGDAATKIHSGQLPPGLSLMASRRGSEALNVIRPMKSRLVASKGSTLTARSGAAIAKRVGGRGEC